MRCCAAMQRAQLELWPPRELWGSDSKPKKSRPHKPAPVNQLRLLTEPGAGRVALTDEELTTHRDQLKQLRLDTEADIEIIDNRLYGGAFRRGKGGFSGTVVRPPFPWRLIPRRVMRRNRSRRLRQLGPQTYLPL
jgi:hypothetical protein